MNEKNTTRNKQKNPYKKSLSLKKSAKHLHKSKKIRIFVAKLRDNEKKSRRYCLSSIT